MSILAAADPEGSVLGVAIAVLAGAGAIVVAALTGVLRVPAAAALAPRVPPARPLLPLAGVLFMGVFVWVAVPSLYFQFAKAGVTPPAPAPEHPEPVPVPTTAPGVLGLSAREVVAINAGVPVLAFIVMAIGDAVVRPVVRQRLGFRLTLFPSGAAWGGVGIALALPLVYCVMVLGALVYRLVDYQPPGEHELLKTIGETPDPFVKYLAVVVAAVIAPLWEELLFRGHVQTLIREGFLRLGQSGRAQATGGYGMHNPAAQEGSPSSTNSEGDLGVALDYEVPPRLAATVDPPPAFAPEPWLAIGITSLLFAGVHQPWQFPPIFCLSLCLGLAYERTGNLWVPVVMHALFNGVMTTIYLWYGASN
jgi:membrane protease YdiL (CAAX protease family)